MLDLQSSIAHHFGIAVLFSLYCVLFFPSSRGWPCPCVSATCLCKCSIAAVYCLWQPQVLSLRTRSIPEPLQP